MSSERRVIDNRVFLLGLDELYREAMKLVERGELLMCARRVASALDASPEDVPIEGYYAEDAKLTEYFLLVRKFQSIDEKFLPVVSALPEFERLHAVASAPLFGEPQQDGKLLPKGRDALFRALDAIKSLQWTVPKLVQTACAKAKESDDISLVGLAALTEDAVLIAAARESVVLYAGEFLTGGMMFTDDPEYVWAVNEDLARQAKRFVEVFNGLFGGKLPAPEPAQAERYWIAHTQSEIVGRCVRIAYDNSVSPMLHYHWGIYLHDDAFAVQDFWVPEIWTTSRYLRHIRRDGRIPELRGVGRVMRNPGPMV